MRVISMFLCAIMAAVGAVAQTPPEKRVALIIANTDYTNAARLPNTANDAGLIAQALRDPRMGFGNNVKVLSNLDFSKFRAALQQFAAEARGADMAVLYYAGHGIEVDKNNYLIPTDARLADPSAVEFETIALDLVVRSVSGARGLKVVILDACRDNPFVPKMRSVGGTRSIGRGLAAVGVDTGDTLIAYAAREGQVAADGAGRNSPYASAFARQVTTPGLEIRQLFGRVRDDVRRQVPQQTPVIYGDLGGSAYYFVPPAVAAQPAPAPSTGPAPAPQPSFDPRQIELSFWESIKTSKNKADFEAYLKKYPNGEYAGLARNRIAELTAKPPAPSIAEPKPAAPAESKPATASARTPGTVFRDCQNCPEMVVVAAGRFTMGSPATEEYRDDDEGPQRQVTIAKAFAVGKFEVTFAEWDACVAAGGCNGYRPNDSGWGRNMRPVINVSWDDVQAYVAWLSRTTGQNYRLLSEAEWEYAARAGTTTPFNFGETISTSKANYNGNFTYGTGAKGEYRQKTVSVGSFSANAFGLYDMHGNVWEWVQDCWNADYKGAPVDGSARSTGSCGQRVLRGGSGYDNPGVLRSANRIWTDTELRNYDVGFRLART
ncbi:MAG TPA: hypothetical protein DCL54_01005, partial [Alphaproteobacteria bacterium]|nr:hypothetical protein [Alphaproteobacteria bacterium]